MITTLFTLISFFLASIVSRLTSCYGRKDQESSHYGNVFHEWTPSIRAYRAGSTDGLRCNHEGERETGGGVDEHDPDPVSCEYLLVQLFLDNS